MPRAMRLLALPLAALWRLAVAAEDAGVCTLTPLAGLADTAPRLISVAAGTLGVGGRRGDGGDALRAQLQSPTGVVVDPARRRLYVADTANHAVRSVDLEAGSIATVLGVLGSYGRAGRGIPEALPQLRSPRGLALDASAADGGGALYVADTDNHVVRVLDLATGAPSVVAGVYASAGRRGDAGPAGAAQLNAPRGVALDPAARMLYISDTHNHAVRACNLATGLMSTLAGVLGSGGLAGNGGDATLSLLHFPYGIVLDAAGQQLFVTEPYNHAVRSIQLASGELSTVAGTLGVPGSSGDEGPATSAFLHFPYGIDFDASARQLYVADANNHVVRLVALATGLIWNVAGVSGSFGRAGNGGPATAAQLSYPTDVAVDPAGRKLYVADRSNHAIRTVDLAARGLVTLAGKLGIHGYSGDGQPPGAARLHSPRALAFDVPAQRLYVADASNRAIRLLDLATHSVSTAVGPAAAAPAVNLTLVFPCGVAVDAKGNSTGLYIADAGGNAVYFVDIYRGSWSVLVGPPPSEGWAVRGPPVSVLNTPYDLALDSSGRWLYIADAGNHAVRLLDLTSGALSTLAGIPGSAGLGGDGGLATAAQLQMPCGIALDQAGFGEGRLYIADTQNHAIRMVDLGTLVLTTLAGALGVGGHAGDGGPRGSAQLYFPYSVAVDSLAQQLYIADNWNHAIRHVDLVTGLLTTLAGVLGSYGHAGDEGRANQAQLYFPMGVAMDVRARRLFVADSGNHAVRLVALADEMRRNCSTFGLV